MSHKTRRGSLKPTDHGRIEFDERGVGVWKWRTLAPGGDDTIEFLSALNPDALALQKTRESKALGGGSNPYDQPAPKKKR